MCFLKIFLFLKLQKKLKIRLQKMEISEIATKEDINRYYVGSVLFI